MQQKQNYIELISDLSNAKGASGFEDEVVKVASAYCSSFANTKEDSIRNLYLTGKQYSGTKPVLMLDAHSDEVAFMVQSIQANGMLSFLNLGNFTKNTLIGQAVLVRNALGQYIKGVVSSKPHHFTDHAPASQDLLSIDIGARSAKEAEEVFHIRIGEPGVPATSFEQDEQNDLLFGKAFDCRIGCAAMIATFERLQSETLPFDLAGTLTAQEELGERGAMVAVNTVAPNICIVFEGAPADDTFQTEGNPQTCLKKGPMLRFMDNEMVSNPRFTRFALDIAQKYNIPVQTAVRSGGGTNGSVIHVSGKGVPVIVIGIPVRYIHAPCGITSYSDFAAAVDLAVAVCRELTPELMESF